MHMKHQINMHARRYYCARKRSDAHVSVSRPVHGQRRRVPPASGSSVKGRGSRFLTATASSQQKADADRDRALLLLLECMTFIAADAHWPVHSISWQMEHKSFRLLECMTSIALGCQCHCPWRFSTRLPAYPYGLDDACTA